MKTETDVMINTIKADLALLGIQGGITIDTTGPAGPSTPKGYFELQRGGSDLLKIRVGRLRDAISGVAWLKERCARGFELNECLGRRERAFGRVICLARRWKPVYKQCIDVFPMEDGDIRRLAELGATGLLNGWCEGITFHFNELLYPSEIFPDIISDDLRRELKAIWKKRVTAASCYDLDVWSVVRAPFGTGGHVRPRELVMDSAHQAFIRNYPDLFGYSPVSQISNPMCLKNARVRDFYTEVYQKTVVANPCLKGFLLWPGDGDMDICRCEKCSAGSNGIVGAYADFVNVIYEASRTVRSDIEFFLIPWHCLMYDNRFETLMPLLSADIGLVIPKTGNLMELAETQGATLRRKGGLNQPFLLKRGWSVDTRDLVEAAKIMKRPYLFFDSFCAGEDSNPVPFFPAPATVAGKVIEISSSSQDACGVVDFWGIDPRRLEVNEVVFQESLWRSPNENVEAVLSNTVRRRFSLTDKTIIAKIREAWEHLDQAFQKKWRVISFGQRLENCFYGWRDETFPPCPPAHEHEGFSAGPIAGDLMLKIATTSRFQRAEKELPYLTQQSATRFLQESQGAAATALYRAIAEIQEAIGSIEHHAIETHFNFLHAAAIHFETFANNFEAKGIIDDVSTGKQTEKQAIKQLVNIAQKEVSNWRWIESFVEKYGFEETYWPNELQRRLQIQEAWTTPAKWPQFFSNLKKKNS